MSLGRLIFWLTLLVVICLLAAGQWIDFSRQSNAQVMRTIERGQ